MSPYKHKNRKLKEKSAVDKEIIEELRTKERKKKNKLDLKKKSKLDLKKKRKRDKGNGVDSVADDQLFCKDDDAVVKTNHEDFDGECKRVEKKRKRKKNKMGLKIKGNRENENAVYTHSDDRISPYEDADAGMIHPSDRLETDLAKSSAISQTLSVTSGEPAESDCGSKIKTKKGKKGKKHKTKETHISTERNKEETRAGVEQEVDEISSIDEDCSRGMKKKGKKGKKHKTKETHMSTERKKEETRVGVEQEVDEISSVDEDCSRGMKKKGKKGKKHKTKETHVSTERKKEETRAGVEQEVDEISSVDEDCSRGMKKWLIKYKESRPGLSILQQRIDDYITAYEEQHEQERKEREAKAAEGGWTVVVHHKGRKKTTDTESGVSVGSVAEAAVVDKIGRKKSKEPPLDFYRFQKREAQRKEVMLLQSKFEQDKKRIQQLRAARKFRPY